MRLSPLRRAGASPLTAPGWRSVALVLVGMLVATTAQPAAGQYASGIAGAFTGGPLALAFDSSGGWHIRLSGQLAVEGTYRLRADTLVVRDRAGPRACGQEVTGTYLWVRTEQTLKLSALADDCGGRRSVLIREWTDASTRVEALTGVTLIDGTGSAARPGTTVLVENGRIRDVFPDGAKPIPAGAERTDLHGRWAMPGLIDTHVHLATDPSAEDARALVLPRLRAALYGGVTTVRDMAGDARVLAELARAAALDEIEAPDIVYSALFAGSDFFRDPRVVASSRGATPGDVPWARAVRPSTDLHLAVAEAKGSGARDLKLYAALDGPTVEALVREAHSQGLLVWAHATLFPARPTELVQAGVDVVSHASLLAGETLTTIPSWTQRKIPDFASIPTAGGAIDPLLRRMADRRTILDATLFIGLSAGKPTPMGEWADKVTARAHALGVRISAGTDSMIGAGPGAAPNLHEELALLVERAGLTPLEAISAATSVAAGALGLQEDRGVIAPGMRADLIVLERDPGASIRHTRAIVWVMKHGRRYTPAGR